MNIVVIGLLFCIWIVDGSFRLISRLSSGGDLHFADNFCVFKRQLLIVFSMFEDDYLEYDISNSGRKEQ